MPVPWHHNPFELLEKVLFPKQVQEEDSLIDLQVKTSVWSGVPKHLRTGRSLDIGGTTRGSTEVLGRQISQKFQYFV